MFVNVFDDLLRDAFHALDVGKSGLFLDVFQLDKVYLVMLANGLDTCVELLFQFAVGDEYYFCSGFVGGMSFPDIG